MCAQVLQDVRGGARGVPAEGLGVQPDGGEAVRERGRDRAGLALAAHPAGQRGVPHLRLAARQQGALFIALAYPLAHFVVSGMEVV